MFCQGTNPIKKHQAAREQSYAAWQRPNRGQKYVVKKEKHGRLLDNDVHRTRRQRRKEIIARARIARAGDKQTKEEKKRKEKEEKKKERAQIRFLRSWSSKHANLAANSGSIRPLLTPAAVTADIEVLISFLSLESLYRHYGFHASSSLSLPPPSPSRFPPLFSLSLSLFLFLFTLRSSILVPPSPPFAFSLPCRALQTDPLQ